jgi:hypothetical protein
MLEEVVELETLLASLPFYLPPYCSSIICLISL